jgi:branched-chain amino acid transport system substrate-binding protein
MRNHRVVGLAGLFLLAVMLLVGPAGTSSVHAQGTQKTLTIGVVAWLGWGLGLDMVNGITLLSEMINKKGGLTIAGEKYNIRLVVVDSKLSQDTARGAVEKLVYQDKVKFVVGDETVDAWLPITEENKVLVVAGTPSPALFNPKYKYVFQGTAIQCQMQEIFGWFAKNYPNKKTQVFAAPDFKVGHLEGDKAERVAKAYGFKMLDTIYYPMQQTDVSAIGTKIKSINPDIVTFDAGGPVKEGLNWKAAREAGYTGQFLAPNSATVGSVMSAGAANLEGYIGGMYALELETTPVAKEYKDAYVAKYGKWNDPDTLFANTGYLVLSAIQQADSVDPEKVAATIAKGIKFDSPNGPCMTVARPDLNNNRAVDTIVALGIKTIHDGKAKLVHQLTLDEAFQLNKQFYGWK